jgi:sn-glycerol 3-phosphate transport system substrate-binding protein
MKLKSLVFAAAVVAAAPAYAQVEVQWWHSMPGALGEWVNGLAKDFNDSQKAYKIVPTFKGTYDESMAAAIAAFRAGNAPHVLQVFEVGTATMMASKSAIVPVAKVMGDAGYKFDPAVYVPAVSGYYTAPNGQMLSFPFNSSTTVFHYNKDAFKAAGLDPESPPRTWPEVARAAAVLKASGHKCPLTSSWISWTQLESFSAWHNVEFATKRNGFNGLDARLAFNTPLHVRHIENLANLSKQGLFHYKGRAGAADPSFVSGECAMYTGSSAAYGNIKRNGKFEFRYNTLAAKSQVVNTWVTASQTSSPLDSSRAGGCAADWKVHCALFLFCVCL